jgi:tRNA(Arg) A34 adenosine deaminase TadA
MPSSNALLHRAVALARRNVREAGGYPFGAVLAHDDTVLHEAVNECAQTGDPTAHAEMVALREAGREHGPEAVAESTMYASGIPCPMCLAAMHFAGLERVVYAFSQEDAAPYGLSTEPVYEELRKPEAERAIEMRYNPVRVDDDPPLYQLWQETTDGS